MKDPLGVEFNDEEKAALREMGEEDILKAAERAEADPEKEEPTEDAPDEKPAEPPAKDEKPDDTPPPAAAKKDEPDVMSPAELTRSIRDLQRENAGLRGDLVQERRRRQAAEDLYRQRPPAKKEGEDEEELELEADADGRVKVPTSKLADLIVKRLRGQGAEERDGAARAVRQVSDEAQEVFEQTRAAVMRDAPDPELVSKAADTMFEATAWLDRRVAEELPRFHARFANMPPGLERIELIVKEGGIGKEMAEKFPDLDPLELADAALSRQGFRFRRSLEGYTARLRERSKAPAKSQEEPQPKEDTTPPAPRRGFEERPKPMGRRGGRGAETVPAARARMADLKPDDVWNMSDEDFEQMERVATADD